MLKNLALASVIALADAVKLECCPGGCGDHAEKDQEFIDAVADAVVDAIKAEHGGTMALVAHEAETAID